MTEIATNPSEPLDFAQTFCRAIDARDRLAVVELADTSEMDPAEVRQELAEDTGAVDLHRLTEVEVFARAFAEVLGSAKAVWGAYPCVDAAMTGGSSSTGAAHASCEVTARTCTSLPAAERQCAQSDGGR